MTQGQIDAEQSFDDIPKPQRRRAPRPLSEYVYGYGYRDAREGMTYAFLSGHYTLKMVGRAFCVSYATVAREFAKFED